MSLEKEIVYLVDGSSYIHRAYHAIRSLATSGGKPTNAIFGFTNMVLKLVGDKTPIYAAVVFDAKGPTFRHEIYEAYKANRPPMPEDMAEQIPYIKKIVEGLGLKMLEKPGFEADDIMGTLGRILEEKGCRVVMVTGDKDFRQLITADTSMWDTMKDKVTDFDALTSAVGLEPEKIIDVMGLSGDTSDNIPGVPGVGEKTAIKLVREFGSLESVFEHLDEISGEKLKERLAQAHDAALLSKRLVTIDRFVPLKPEETDLRVEEPRRELLADIFRELEFRSLWERFAAREAPVEADYRLILAKEELTALIGRIRREKMVSVDTETTSENPFQADLVGISFSLEEGKGWYLPVGHHYIGAPAQIPWSAAREALRDVLEDEAIRKVGQNIKYDAEVLARHGLDLKGIGFDTMIASYVINPGLRQHNLDYLAQHYLNHRMIAFQEVVGKGKNRRCFSEVDVERAMAYSCEDADITLRLMGLLEERLKADRNEALFYDLEMKLLPVLMDMEMAGIRIDTEFFKQMSERFARQMQELEQKIHAEAGMTFNINSPQQLGEVLFEKLGLPAQGKTAKTKKYATDVKVLKRLCAYPQKMPRLVLRYRTLSKLKSTYLDALVKIVAPETGRVHTSFNQSVAATGRLSSSNPNLQNIPIRGEEGREIRKGFVAKEGCRLVSADYSQVELRVFAHYSGDEAFIEAFNRGEDIHTRTAAEIMGVTADEVTPDMRRIAKAINFGIIYGMGFRKLGEELDIDRKTAKKPAGTDMYPPFSTGGGTCPTSSTETASFAERRNGWPSIPPSRGRPPT